MKQEEHEELATLAALELLEGEDLARWNVHLDGCLQCRTETRELADSASLIGLAIDPVAPPAAVRERVLNDFRSARARRGLQTSPMLLAAAAIVLIVATAAITRAVITAEPETVSTREQQILAENRALSARVDELSTQLEGIASPETRQFSLQGLEASPSSSARVFLDVPRRRALIFFSDLPRSESEEQFQLWIIPADGAPPMDAGVFESEPDGTASLELQNLPVEKEIQGFAVTIEPRGGRPQPSGQMILHGNPPV